MGDDLTLLGAELVHRVGQAVTHEQAHEVVLDRDEELARAGIALTSLIGPELAVDAPRLVAFRAQDVEAASLDDVVVGLALEVHVPGRIHGNELVQIETSLLGPAHRAGIGDALAQLNVGSATGHVGGDGHGAGASRLRHDLRLLLVLLGVQDVVDDSRAA